MATEKLVIELMADGSLKVDATGLSGSEKQIMAELVELSGCVGGRGAVAVERHIHGAHTHTHTDTRIKSGHGH